MSRSSLALLDLPLNLRRFLTPCSATGEHQRDVPPPSLSHELTPRRPRHRYVRRTDLRFFNLLSTAARLPGHYYARRV